MEVVDPRGAVPSRDSDVERLIAAYTTVAQARSAGQIVFVAGREGSGRTRLLRTLAREFDELRPGPVVLSGAFEGGHYVPWSGSVQSEHQMLLVLERLVSLAEPVVPFAGLVSEVLTKSRAARELVQGMLAQSERTEPSMLLPRLLREVCEEGPVVCLVDDADKAEAGWWADLVLLFAQNVARDLPLMLVLSVDGPPELGAHHDDEPESLYVARQLTAARLADWHPLAAVTMEGLARWTGDAAPDVLEALRELTSARAGWAADLWHDWRHRGAVVREEGDGRWVFATGARERTLDPVADVLAKRLKEFIGKSDVRALDRARELLACAALEGREFTAEAVAEALRREHSEVSHVLDSMLTANDPGLLEDAGLVRIHDDLGERTLRLYRFSAKLHWLTLRRYGPATAEPAALGLDLARAMEAQYGRETHRVAHALARLFREGRDIERSRHYQRMADVGVNRAVILWRARGILSSTGNLQDAWHGSRAFKVLIAAASELYYSGPFDEGLAFAQAARRCAFLPGDQAQAARLEGVHLRHLGKSDQARAAFESSLALYLRTTDRVGELSARNSLAALEASLGRLAPARDEFIAVLEMCLALRDRRREATVRGNLANIDSATGNYANACAELTRVLAINRKLGDSQREAHTLTSRAIAYLNLQKEDKALGDLARALHLYREGGDKNGEATVRYRLAEAAVVRGEYERAFAEFTRVLELYRQVGNAEGEAKVRQWLAQFVSRPSDWSEPSPSSGSSTSSHRPRRN